MTDSERIKRTKEYRQIYSSLVEQLERSGNDTPYFLNQIDQYMSMYITTKLCAEDIDRRGINITSVGSTGQTVTKKNESIDSLLKTNQQMIKLLDKLQISPETAAADDEEL